MKHTTLNRTGLWSVFLVLGLVLSCAAPRASQGQENGSIAALKRMGNAFASVAKRASPAVVGIQSTKKTIRAVQETPFDPSSEDPFEFFRRRAPREETPGREHTQRAQGSGFIISQDGYIITNNHVVEDADRLTVELVDGRTLEAQVVGADPESDVAVVRIQAGDLQPIALGNSESLQVGEWVLAIGTPLGLSHTVTAGIVSGIGRSGFNVATYENFIQTDAAINMGNSGGPLVNLDGEAVGINTFILAPGGGNVGIGFAIPIDIAKDVADQLIKTGAVERGYLGIVPQRLTPELAEAFGLKEPQGAVLSQVAEDSAAARAGLKRDDVVLELDGVKIESASQLRNLIAGRKPGENVKIVIARDGNRETLTAMLDKRPSAQELRGQLREPSRPPDETQKRLGLSVRDLTPAEAERLGFAEQTGVLITKVTPESEAAEKGLRAGYVIKGVNRQAVANVQQFKEMVSQSLRDGRRILLLITDGQVSQYVVLNPSSQD